MRNRAFFALFAFGTFSVGMAAHAGVSSLNTSTSIRPISQYGLIQNVQDYSSNPFWSANSPYNLTFPRPVYVQGPELNTADCQTVVSTLVASYCMANNNCVGMQISDIRPVVMVQLARMPGHNYASACSGYIDSEFDSYVEKYSAAVPFGTVSFPGATTPNPDYNSTEFKLENPYERQDGTWNGEEWQKEKKERIQELKDLQAQNGAGYDALTKTNFPTTFADLTFTERLDVKTTGYEPFKDSSSYKQIKIEDEETFRSRLSINNQNQYCLRHPDDPRCPHNTANNQNATADNSFVPGVTTDGTIRLVLR